LYRTKKLKQLKGVIMLISVKEFPWFHGLLSLVWILLATPCCSAVSRVSIVPQPVEIKLQPGEFILKSKTVIFSSPELAKQARQLAALLAPATGYDLAVTSTDQPGQSEISLALDPNLGALGREGYQMSISSLQVSIRASQVNGIFYGMQTLRQLLPTEIFRDAKVPGIAWKVPCLQIKDFPRFQWRGLMLDCSRHFMPKEFVKKFIDLLALQKMNSFHWHLTDDQGWRIEIKKYPRLTEVGGWRKETLLGKYDENKPFQYDGTPHGGFYSQNDIREVVEYARDRFVNVVPEIEMPGHAQAAIAAYPELGCTPKPLEVFTRWGVNPNIFNPSENTILFLQDVLTEVLELFPSPFIHVGGDEAIKPQWKENPEIQARIKSLNLKNEEEMQSYVIRRMDEFLTSKGRRLIGWDEILEGGLAPNATVMSWRGEEGGIAAAKAGHDVVMAPTKYTYLDYYQSKPVSQEPLAIGGYVPLEMVYNYEPVPKEIAAADAHHVLGAQGQIWTEYLATPKQVEYMAYPRAAALAEGTWSPKGQKKYSDFLQRLKVQALRWKSLDVNYRSLPQSHGTK
jgi:hexosaminidase